PWWLGKANGERTTKEAALRVLQFILRFGLLLTPEPIRFSRNPPTPPPPGDAVNVRQRRVCFSLMRRPEFKESSGTFGPMTLEFDPSHMRKLGAVPVIYVPTVGETDPREDRFARLATDLVGCLVDAFSIVRNIQELKDALHS